MCSNEEINDFSTNRDTESVDNSVEKLEEVKATTLENSSNQSSLSIKNEPRLKLIKKFSTKATQTPLTMIPFTLIQSSVNNYFIDLRTSSTHFNEEFHESMKSLSCTLIRNQMSSTLSHEAATQATLLQPTLKHSGSRTSRDNIVQISTSFSSSMFEPKSEILTVTTDYDNSSPDTHSILVDTIDLNANQGLHFSVRDTHEPSRVLDFSLSNVESTSNNTFTRRTEHWSWNIIRSLNNCLRCMSEMNNESDTRPYMRDAPPTYSTIYATRATMARNNQRSFRSRNRSSFTAPIPPPSYVQAQGIPVSCSVDQLFSISPNARRLWSSRPVTAICPRCSTIIVTNIQERQSIITHASAAVLFLCGCWPCCMIPYCMNACKNIDHYCPACHAYLGTYRPW